MANGRIWQRNNVTNMAVGQNQWYHVKLKCIDSTGKSTPFPPLDERASCCKLLLFARTAPAWEEGLAPQMPPDPSFHALCALPVASQCLNSRQGACTHQLRLISIGSLGEIPKKKKKDCKALLQKRPKCRKEGQRQVHA